MREALDIHCISSAVVAVLPDRVAAVARQIAQMRGVEICACENGRIVIVLEASSSGELSARLAAIGNLDGVVAANMVFEHAEPLGIEGRDGETEPA